MTHHVLDIYGTHLHLATTKAQWKKIAKEFGLDKETPGSAGQVTTLTRRAKHDITRLALIIWVDTANHATIADLIDSCAHEASHAAGRILEHAGHPLPHTDEPHAYLVGWLTSWIWQHITP